jgi:2-methylaconitate isomerase
MTSARAGLSAIPAVFMRGGTSKALFFHRKDLPSNEGSADCAAWNAIFCAALGTPDANGRQLDGMGGGLSSLSKIAIIGPSTCPDADVDFTFAQVGIKDPVVSYRGTCGNISSAVGPFAVDEGLVEVSGNQAKVRIYNTNTSKIVVARFGLVDGRAAVDGDMSIAGVAGQADAIKLSFLDPGGAATGKLLPTGSAQNRLSVTGLGEVAVSLVDAANPTVFADAESLGLTGVETPIELEENAGAMKAFEELRIASAVAMGLCSDYEARHTMKNLPLISIIAPRAQPAESSEAGADVVTRMISAGQPHRATPLTGAMCLAVAAHIPGTIVQGAVGIRSGRSGDLRIGHASGSLQVGAVVREVSGTVVADEVVVYRTARRLMDGRVFFRSSLFAHQ